MRAGSLRVRAGRQRVACTLALSLAATGTAQAKRPDPRATQALAAQPRESPEERLARGRQAYLRNDFEGTVRAVQELLYPEIRLRSDEDVQSAHRLLALAFLFQKDEARAEAEFTALLQLNPNFTLDAVMDPPAALAFLDRLKKREIERVEEIERRRREEAERVRREAERQREEEEARRMRELEERIRREIKPVVIERHSLAVAFTPFGVGQFQNGQRWKGWGFLGSQLALGAISVGCWATIQLMYDGGLKRVPHEEWDGARLTQGVALAAGGMFWIDVAWGIVDALVHFKPSVRYTLDPDAPGPNAPTTTPGATLAPFAAPGGGGLSIGGTF